MTTYEIKAEGDVVDSIGHVIEDLRRATASTGNWDRRDRRKRRKFWEGRRSRRSRGSIMPRRKACLSVRLPVTRLLWPLDASLSILNGPQPGWDGYSEVIWAIARPPGQTTDMAIFMTTEASKPHEGG